MILYHRTSRAAARKILKEDFRDGHGTYLTDRKFSGFWLSNVPLDENEGAHGDVLLKVDLDVSAKAPREWEWIEDGKPYRVFLIPADFVNRNARNLRDADEGTL